MQNSYDDNKLTAARYEDFHEALEALYIRRNLSGRLKFLAAWPEAAAQIFGPELIDCDQNGAPDRERRAVLEGEAELRRLELLETTSTLEERSVVENALDLDYARSVVENVGRGIALDLYAQRIVDRVIPPPADENIQTESEGEETPIVAEKSAQSPALEDMQPELEPEQTPEPVANPVASPPQKRPLKLIGITEMKSSEENL